MDDWFTYVLIFIFFVLPMIEGVLKKRRGQDVELPPDVEHPEMPARVRREPSLPGGTATADSDDSWSDGWGSWPGEDLQDEVEPERVPAWSAPDQPDRYTADVRTADVPRTPVEIVVPSEPVVLSDFRPTPESQRLPDVASRLDQIAKAESAPIRVSTATMPAVARPPSVSVKQRRSRVSALLGDPASVRRAIIASEVLGAPLAMRDRPRD